MGSKYPRALKEYAINELMNGGSLSRISRETNINESLLFRWLRDERKKQGADAK